MTRHSGLLKAVAVAAVFLLFGCGGGGGGGDSPPAGNTPGNNDPGSNPSAARFTVGGTATGLRANDALSMRMTTPSGIKSDARVAANGAYTFPDTVAANESYAVTVESKPADLPCTVSNATGVATANVTNVSVLCLSVSGRVDGLNGVLQLQLSVDGGVPMRRRVDDDNAVADPNCFACGTFFFFPFAVAQGQSYAVSVALQPDGQQCTVANGSGTMGSTHVSNVSVTCATTGTVPPYFSVSGSVVGTPIGRTGIAMSVDGDTAAGPFVMETFPAFTLPHRLRSGQSYSVSLPFPASTGNCIVQNGNGIIGSANVTNVVIDCTTIPTYTVGGSVSGLIAGGANGLVLSLFGSSGGTTTKFTTSDGAFTFDSLRLVGGQGYTVGVHTQPNGQTCTVSNGSGFIGSGNVTNVSVTCTTTLTCPAISGATVTGASFSGNVSVSGLTTTPLVPVLNYGVSYSSPSFSVSGSLKLRLWAIRSSYTGGEPTFDRPEAPHLVATFQPVFTGRAGAASVNQVFNGATISNLTTIGSASGLDGSRPARGVYCLMATLDQFDSSCTTWEDGYCMADYHQFAQPVIFE